jgi:hypothetical protein
MSAITIEGDNQIRTSQPELDAMLRIRAGLHQMGCHDQQEYNLIALFRRCNVCDIVN